MLPKEYTLEEANRRIKELEEEVAALKKQLAEYEKRLPVGRKKHDDKWMACYDQFVTLYEQGNKIPVIVERTGFSRRTVYRYKEYYDQLVNGTCE